MPLRLQVRGLSHRFGKTHLFKDLSFSLDTPGILVITGPNGAGKSTLLKILGGLIRPTQGEVIYRQGEKSFTPKEMWSQMGYCAPETRMYEELTGLENLHFFSSLRGFDPKEAYPAIKTVGLWKARNKLVRYYSSGMKQRLKILLASFYHPRCLLLDEPSSNLDREGRRFVFAQIEAYAHEDTLILLATNDPEEASLGTQKIELD